MNQPKNSVKVLVRGKMLSLSLPRIYCGRLTRFSLKIPDNPANRKFAELKAKQIETDFISGQFDTSLAKYKPILDDPIQSQEANKLVTTLPKIYLKYIEFKKNTISQTTYKYSYLNTLNHLNSCPYTLPSEALKLKDWLLANRTPDTTRRILMQLNAACNWAVERDLLKTNPFAGRTKVNHKRLKAKIHPFSSEEKAVILDAFAKSTNLSYLLPLIKFFFLTGCRTSEALGLRWKNIRADCSSISFEEVMVLGKGGVQRKQGTKQAPQRDFPCNRQLRSLLLSIKPKSAIGDASVFLRPDGTPITHQNLRDAWFGRSKKMGIVRELAVTGAIDSYRPQYNTRHTMISACLEAGISPVQIAQWVGNSAEIIFRNYAGLINKISVPEF